MTRSKNPFDQSQTWRQPDDNPSQSHGADHHFDWPGQPPQPGLDPNVLHAQEPPPAFPQGPAEGVNFGNVFPHPVPPDGGAHRDVPPPQGDGFPFPQQPHGYGYADHQAGDRYGGQAPPNYDVPPTEPHHQHAYPQPPSLSERFEQAQLHPSGQEPQPADPGFGSQPHGDQQYWQHGGEQHWQAGEGRYQHPHHEHQHQHQHQHYDLGNYKPAGQPDRRPAFGEPGYMPGQDWTHNTPGPYPDDPAGVGPGFNDPAGSLPAYPDQSGHGAVTQHDDGYGDEDEYEDYDEFEEDGGGGTRKFIIAAALVSTIVVGGGFAYGYNVLFASAPDQSAAPVVKAKKAPAKIQPVEPGGRKFVNQDSKVLDKIGNRGQADAQAGSAGRVRKVRSIQFGRDGRMIIPATEKTAPAPTAAAPGPVQPVVADTVPIPGMTIQGGLGSVQPAAQPAVPQAQPQAGAGAPTTPPLRPAKRPAAAAVVASRSPPLPAVAPTQTAPVRRRNSKYPPLPVRSGIAKPVVSPAVAQPVVQTPQANVRQVVPRVNERPAVAATGSPAATSGATDGAVAAGAGNGYVAVLSTKRSRIDALTSFADLQQRYGGILSAKVPDVRRADLSSRGLGVMYRAVVGPPGSRQVAARLCTRLKTAGYSGCWVAPY